MNPLSPSHSSAFPERMRRTLPTASSAQQARRGKYKDLANRFTHSHRTATGRWQKVEQQLLTNRQHRQALMHQRRLNCNCIQDLLNKNVMLDTKLNENDAQETALFGDMSEQFVVQQRLAQTAHKVNQMMLNDELPLDTTQAGCPVVAPDVAPTESAQRRSASMATVENMVPATNISPLPVPPVPIPQVSPLLASLTNTLHNMLLTPEVHGAPAESVQQSRVPAESVQQSRAQYISLKDMSWCDGIAFFLHQMVGNARMTHAQALKTVQTYDKRMRLNKYYYRQRKLHDNLTPTVQTKFNTYMQVNHTELYKKCMNISVACQNK